MSLVRYSKTRDTDIKRVSKLVKRTRIEKHLLAFEDPASVLMSLTIYLGGRTNGGYRLMMKR